MLDYGYKVVMNTSDNEVSFTVEGENLLIIRHAVDCEMQLEFPDGVGEVPDIITFTKHDQQRFVVPRGTVLKLVNEGGGNGNTVWIGPIVRDLGGLVL